MAKWYPSRDQLKDPESTQRAMKQVLDQLYTLQDSHSKLQAAHATLKSRIGEMENGPIAGSGPSDSMLLGLPVQPVDVQTLANGATLKFNKTNGRFEIS